MRKHPSTALTIAALALSFTVCAAALADQYTDGFAAKESGDYATAVKLWRPLAEQGHGEAQLSLGIMYTLGEGVAQDGAEARKWLLKAAEQGVGLYIVATMLEAGTPPDLVQAYKWFLLAGTPNGQKRVAKKMTPDQIAEAERLAREWLAAHPEP